MRERVSMIQYDNCDLRLDACHRLADDLRTSGKYRRVTVRRRGSGFDGAGRRAEFGRVYVSREW